MKDVDHASELIGIGLNIISFVLKHSVVTL